MELNSFILIYALSLPMCYTWLMSSLLCISYILGSRMTSTFLCKNFTLLDLNISKSLWCLKHKQAWKKINNSPQIIQKFSKPCFLISFLALLLKERISKCYLICHSLLKYLHYELNLPIGAAKSSVLSYQIYFSFIHWTLDIVFPHYFLLPSIWYWLSLPWITCKSAVLCLSTNPPVALTDIGQFPVHLPLSTFLM